MTVKKIYKALHKAFPKSDVWVANDIEIRWLTIPSKGMTKYGKCQVIDLETDTDIDNGNTVFILKVD